MHHRASRAVVAEAMHEQQHHMHDRSWWLCMGAQLAVRQGKATSSSVCALEQFLDFKRGFIFLFRGRLFVGFLIGPIRVYHSLHKPL